MDQLIGYILSLNEDQRKDVRMRREKYQSEYKWNEDNLRIADEWLKDQYKNVGDLLIDFVSRNNDKTIKFMNVVNLKTANSIKDLLVSAKNLPKEKIKLYAVFRVDGEVFYKVERGYKNDQKYYNRFVDLITYGLHSINFDAICLGYMTERSQKNKSFRTFTRVANSTADNCVVQCILTLGRKNRELLYERFPSLIPNGSPIYIDNNIMNDLAKYFRCKINTYSALGAMIPSFPPWQTFGHSNDKKIDIVISNEHATMKFLPRVDRVVLHESIDDITMKVNVSCINYFPDSKIIDNYIEYNTNPLEVVMHKTYKTAGTNVNYAYCHSDDKYYTKLFKEKYMVDGISDPIIRNIVRSSEYFIKCRKDSSFTLDEFNNGGDDVLQCDANKCYVAYETNDYYIGFPVNSLRVAKYTGGLFSFCVVSKYENLPESFLYFNPVVNNVLSYPLYKYLVDNGAEITIDYVLVSEFKKISIVDFSETLLDSNGHKLNSDNKKHFRNQLIGRLISGGINEKIKKRITCANEAEYEQIIYECNAYKDQFGIEYAPVLGIDLCIDVSYNYNTKGCFSFHSYILSYANIMMMKQYDIIKGFSDTTIIGHIVDAIIIRTKNLDIKSNIYNPLRREVGGFKYEYIKQYFSLLKPRKVENKINYNDFNIRCPSRIIENTLHLGPGGIAKSYNIISRPIYSQIITTHSKQLRDDTKNTIEKLGINSHCCCIQKYAQPSVSDKCWLEMRRLGKIPGRRSYVMIDEVLKLTMTDLDIIFNRLINIDKSVVELTGDFEQVKNNIDNKKLDIEFFVNWGFKIVEHTRSIDTIGRHKYEYGMMLDSFRGKTYEQQIELVKIMDITRMTEDNIVDLDSTCDHILCGNYNRIRVINNMIKNTGYNIQVKDRSGKKSVVGSNNSLIWYNRSNMSEKMPTGYKYEPIFALTVDCFQGTTADEGQNIVIDIISLNRSGCLYTAITRTRTVDNMIILEK